MSKSTAQLRKELAAAVEHYRTDTAYYGQLIRGAERMANAAQALLDALDAQPSRRGKPWRVTYQHQQGHHAGRVYKNSHYDPAQAARQMRTVIGAGGRVALSHRDDDGEYHELDVAEMAKLGYTDIAGSGLYGGKHYSQEH